MAMKRERAIELLIRVLDKYAETLNSDGNRPTNDLICSELGIGKRELKELGLDFDKRRYVWSIWYI